MKNYHTKDNLVWKINILENICIVLILIIKRILKSITIKVLYFKYF